MDRTSKKRVADALRAAAEVLAGRGPGHPSFSAPSWGPGEDKPETSKSDFKWIAKIDDLDGEADESWAKSYASDLRKIGITDLLVVADRAWPPELAVYFNAPPAKQKKALALLAVLLGYELNPKGAVQYLIKNPKYRR